MREMTIAAYVITGDVVNNLQGISKNGMATEQNIIDGPWPNCYSLSDIQKMWLLLLYVR